MRLIFCVKMCNSSWFVEENRETGKGEIEREREKNKSLENVRIQKRWAKWILLSFDDTAFGWADAGLWFWANRAEFSFIVDESIVFCRLKLLLLHFFFCACMKVWKLHYLCIYKCGAMCSIVVRKEKRKEEDIRIWS